MSIKEKFQNLASSGLNKLMQIYFYVITQD